MEAGQERSGGARLADTGDIDGNGRDDLLAGAPGNGAGKVFVFSTAGIPSGGAVFGSGCAGSAGWVPELEAVEGDPRSAIGNLSFGIRLDSALGATPAVLLAGLSPQFWGSIALPLNLDFPGLPACALRVSPDVAIPVVTGGAGPGAGTAEVALPIPVSPGLSGGLPCLRWHVFDPGPPPPSPRPDARAPDRPPLVRRAFRGTRSPYSQ